MADAGLSNYDLTRLQAELEQEREMKEMLAESVSDLRSTMADLEERLHSVDGEGNEWKTRYETQLELNGQLEQQIALVHERLEGLSGNPMDRLASVRLYDAMPVDALRQRLKLLTNEKASLQSQLSACRLGLQQEGKAYQKANDERRAYLAEITKVSSTLDASRKRQLAQPRGLAQSSLNRGHGSRPSKEHDPEVKRGVRGPASVSRLPRLKQ